MHDSTDLKHGANSPTLKPCSKQYATYFRVEMFIWLKIGLSHKFHVLISNVGQLIIFLSHQKLICILFSIQLKLKYYQIRYGDLTHRGRNFFQTFHLLKCAFSFLLSCCLNLAVTVSRGEHSCFKKCNHQSLLHHSSCGAFKPKIVDVDIADVP